jgi:hypothetical protein
MDPMRSCTHEAGQRGHAIGKIAPGMAMIAC